MMIWLVLRLLPRTKEDLSNISCHDIYYVMKPQGIPICRYIPSLLLLFLPYHHSENLPSFTTTLYSTL